MRGGNGEGGSPTLTIAGFIHGDVMRRTLCRTQHGDIFLVDSVVELLRTRLSWMDQMYLDSNNPTSVRF